jgi:ubiquinone/menaquinone biosynthesis C-methylase UbiE
MGKNPSETWLVKEKCLQLQKRFGDYETYEETGGGRGENKKSIIRVLKRLSSTFSEPPSVLEIGSGPGHFLWVMKDVAGSIIGVDSSPHMIEIAENVFKDRNVNAKFILGSCWAIPLPESSYDLVFQVDVCMHVGGSYKSILEMIRVSKKYIVFTGPSFLSKELNEIDKQFGKLSWAISVPLLNKNLDELVAKNQIKKYYYEERPKTENYKHRILVIEK